MTHVEEVARTAPYVRPGTVRLLAKIILWVGVLWVLLGVAYAINGVTQAAAHVGITAVPTVPLAEQLTEVVEPAAGASLTGPAVVTAASSTELHLDVWDSTAAEQALSRGGVVVVGLAVLAAGLLLQPLLLSLADGEPFNVGNSRRIALLAGVVAVGSMASQLPRLAAANLVLERVGGVQGDLLLAAPSYELPLTALLVSLGLMVVAEAFRRGSALVADVDGLI